ncbi:MULTISPECIES: methyltransferase domain-containing protein [Streptomyces]|uniref:Methyltransferase domain-containing protein n=1 Tax=Streptomyces kasugaensis TaxID=1946 RepID=A0A4Q9HPX4_STRKA|nr:MULTISPECIES: methyltransferase domain-containing protein [Streptomyces]MYU56433.1 methyltransferase domain-containing protein [Streptomyces sp. SID7805]TBO56962.1 methyltransferase domain-containing protein [Streptomyces kasugaensis]
MEWKTHAERLAAEVTPAVSRWRDAVAGTPRHVFVPRWWEPAGDGAWALRDGPGDASAWLRAAYSDTSLVTRVGPRHADDASPDERPSGVPTSSGTMPGLVVRMLRHGLLYDGADLGLIGTGTGASTALAVHRLGAGHVTAMDVDPYLTEAATARLASLGMSPRVVTCDATESLPGDFDRIVSMVALRNLAGVLAALRPGGRLVTTLARMHVIVTADKEPDGGARGVVEWDRAGFMRTRTGSTYPSDAGELFAAVRDRAGEDVTEGRYPVLNVAEAWDVHAMLELAAPGVECHYEERGEQRTAWLVHPDGSWARASATWIRPPAVHQGGPRRLWTALERIRHRLNAEGGLPIYGSRVHITPDGVCHFARGRWSASYG